jgi:hypothetical protein
VLILLSVTPDYGNQRAAILRAPALAVVAALAREALARRALR